MNTFALAVGYLCISFWLAVAGVTIGLRVGDRINRWRDRRAMRAAADVWALAAGVTDPAPHLRSVQ